MRVLVTGATGFLGAHLVDALLAHGHEVRALARPSSDTRELEVRGISVVRAGFDDARALRAALDLDAVVHAAGGGMARRVEDVYDANTASTRALAAAVPPTLARFVLVSSLAAHGPSTERPACESDPDAPRSHYGRSKLAAERALAACADRMEVVVVRPPALYGPGEHRMVGLFRAAERGFVPMVHPAGTLSLLHGADCASAIVAALEVPSARGIYYVAEPRVYARREMALLIGRAVGRDVRVLSVAPSVLAWMAAGAELAGALRGAAVVLSRDKVRDASAPHQACDPSRAMNELAWSPRFAFEQGAREACEDYRRRGWLALRAHSR